MSNFESGKLELKKGSTIETKSTFCSTIILQLFGAHVKTLVNILLCQGLIEEPGNRGKTLGNIITG